MKRFLPFLIIAAVAALTIGVISVVLHKARESARATASAYVPENKSDLAAAHTRGSAVAPVTIEEFADFQCPPCGAVFGLLKELEKEYGANLQVIFREFPLPMHQHGFDAAAAAEAAGLQGHFWEMHDRLFETQPVWSKAQNIRPIFNEYARALGLDVERFEKDVAGEQVRERIQHDQARAESIGVKSTPTLFLNNHMLPVPEVNPVGLRAAIKAALKGTPSS